MNRAYYQTLAAARIVSQPFYLLYLAAFRYGGAQPRRVGLRGRCAAVVMFDRVMAGETRRRVEVTC